MPIDLNWIDEHTIELIYYGHITQADLLANYERINAIKNLHFIVADGQNMMYQHNDLFNEDTRTIKKTLLQREANFQKIIMILPFEHKMREILLSDYQQMGMADKLIFVESSEQAEALIVKLREES